MIVDNDFKCAVFCGIAKKPTLVRLVKRERDMADRRKFTVRLTEDGKALIAKILPVHAEIAEHIFSVLKVDELDELGRMLTIPGKSAASGKGMGRCSIKIPVCREVHT